MSATPASAPRYAVLARDLAAEIAQGMHPVGVQLPPEVEMAAARGVSRATLRGALDQLEEWGLVSRRRRAGTHVAARLPVRRGGAYVQALADVEDLLQYAAETERRILRITPLFLPAGLAARLGLAAGSRWVQVCSLRIPSSGGEPLCWTDSYADATALPPDFSERLRGDYQGLIAGLLAEASGRAIAEVRQEIRAGGLDSAAMAEALRAEPGGHVLEIRRHYLDGAGHPLAVTVSVHPAERFSYVTCLRRSSGA